MSDTLAIDGGTPIRKKMLPYGHQSIDDSDLQSVREVLQSEWLTTGPIVSEFEKKFAQLVGAKEAVSVSNGTAALHSAVFVSGIKPGDEVITTPLTFAATANSIRYEGGTVIFADVTADTLNIDPTQIESLITTKTKAIIAVDFAGQPCDMQQIMDIGEKYNLVIIEDAAHSLGATYNSENVGSIANFTTFSMHPVKHITTGEGGIITTNSEHLANRLRTFRNHGISLNPAQRDLHNSWWYDMEELGHNYRLTDIQCGLGLSQLKKLGQWLNRRRQIADIYTQAFSELELVDTPYILKDRNSSWHLYVLRLNLEMLNVGRTQVFQALRAENIGVNVHYIPVPWHPYYQNLGYVKGSWPICESEYERVLSLPLWPGMSDVDVSNVIEATFKVLKAYAR